MRRKLLLIALLVAGCRAPATWPAKGESAPLPVETLVQGTVSGITEERFVVLRSAAELEALWREHTRIVEPPPPVPRVDFERRMVVAAFAGTRPTGGHSLAIVELLAEGQGACVRFAEQKPDRSGMVLTVLTQPHHLVAAPRMEGEVRFERVAGR